MERMATRNMDLIVFAENIKAFLMMNGLSVSVLIRADL
jgi:hypothetical protein